MNTVVNRKFYIEKGNVMKVRPPNKALLTQKLGLRALKLHVHPIMKFIIRN